MYSGHVWRIPRGSSILDRLLTVILAFTAFSLPVEGVLPSYFGIRSLPFYLMAVATVLALLRLPHILSNLRRAPGLKLIIIAFIWSGVLYIFNPLRSHTEVPLMLQLMVLATLMLHVADDEQKRHKLLWSYWVGWFILVILSLLEYLNGNYVIWSRGDVIRVREILGFQANEHVHHIGVGLLVSLSLAARVRKLIPFFIIAISMGSLVFVFGNSKSGSLALGIALVVWLLAVISTKKDRTAATWLAIVPLVLVASYIAFTQTELGKQLFPNFMARMRSTFEQGDLSSRDELLSEGIKLATNNLLGVGQGNSLALMAQTSLRMQIDVHNYYLRLLIEGGILGILLVLMGILRILKQGWQWYIVSGEISYLIALFYILIVAAAVPGFHYKITWFFLSMNSLTPLSTSTSTTLEKS